MVCALAAAAALALLLAGCRALPSPQGFAFAVVGDAPYRSADEQRFAALLRHIDDPSAVRFVLHAGDIKGGGEPCTDAVLRRRLAQLQAVRGALVYTPGDNEWTDCHRPSAGAFHPLERLAALRRLAFPDPSRSFGRRPLRLTSQAGTMEHREFVENVRFSHGGVTFVTLHVVGSNNGLEPWRGIDPEDRPDAPRAERLAEFEQRQAANLAWLRAAFAEAQSVGSIGVVVLAHANPRFEQLAGDARRAGFEALIGELGRLARSFSRPVLLTHGDGHLYLVDRPLAEALPPVPNLLRVQTYGHPWIGWVRIDVDPTHPELFRVRRGDAFAGD